MVSSNIRGEMTDMKPTASRYNMKDGEFVQAVAKSLRVGSEKVVRVYKDHPMD